MRKELLFKWLGVGAAVVLLLGILATLAPAQESAGDLPFPAQSATITLSDSGMEISPSQLNPGPVVFTIVNNSSQSRGVYVTGEDRVGDPIFRYSPRISPSASGTMQFWLYQGKQFTLHDYTSRTVSGGKSDLTSTYSTEVTIPTLIPLGTGPQYQWLSGTITISDSGVSVEPSTSDHGPIVFTVVNNSSSARGVMLRGPDRTGSPIFRYSGIISAGSSRTVNFWLYEGQTYTIQEYARSGMVRGAPRYSTSFSTTLTVNPSSAAAGS